MPTAAALPLVSFAHAITLYRGEAAGWLFGVWMSRAVLDGIQTVPAPTLAGSSGRRHAIADCVAHGIGGLSLLGVHVSLRVHHESIGHCGLYAKATSDLRLYTFICGLWCGHKQDANTEG